MPGQPVVIEGTLRPDGTLDLDEKPNLPPGRVQVIVQPLPELPADDPFWQRIQAIWAGQKARGHVPRSAEQVQAERQALNDEMDQEIDAAGRLQQEARARRDPGGKRPE
jgi:hypothetical protein